MMRTEQEGKEHAARLALGLARLGPLYVGSICFLCAGEGRREQTYTAGCGGGYYRSFGPCDWCNGRGLMQGTSAAPESVVQQVLNAARDAAGVEHGHAK